jgi:antitoxin MazE
MRAQVKKWGNSLALRIPRAFAEDADVSDGSLVDLTVKDGRLVVAPVRRKTVRLETLARGITRANRHEVVDWGGPVGREVW